MKKSKVNFLAVDLDAVCISMTEAAARVHGIDLPEKISEDFLYKELGKERFWSKCSGHDFWANLKPYSWAKDLLDMIDSTGINWCFLSKTSSDPFCSSGKHTCLKTHFPEYLDKLWLTKGTKSYMAGEGRGLLDDKTFNIREWEAAGGIGLHWPELHPSQVDEAQKRIEELRKILTDGVK